MTTKQLNLARVLAGLSQYDLDPEDREALRADADRAGVAFDPNHPYVLFERVLTKATAGAGGFLVATETQEAVHPLLPYSVTARAGIVIDMGLTGDSVVPRWTSRPVPAWLTNESTQAPEGSATVEQIALTPKTASAVVNFSRLLAKQANAERHAARLLMEAVGIAVDQAVLNGSGVFGQPLGLLGAPGVQTQDGTALAHAGVVAMKRKVADANAPDEAISFIGTPAVRELLETRERSATNGSGFVWDDDQVASRPARVSTDVPAATLIAGAWEAIYVGLWGQGFVLDVNPFADFRAGVIQARVMVSLDTAVLHPAAFCKTEAIT